MIDGGEKIVPGWFTADPVSDLQRFGSVALALQSVIVPGGQAPIGREPADPGLPALLLAAGPVVSVPGVVVVAAEPVPLGLVPNGAAVLVPGVLGAMPEPLGAVPLVPPDAPPAVCAKATAERLNMSAVARGRVLSIVIGGSHD